MSEAAKVAPRGHRVQGHALTGNVLFRHVREATTGAGVDVRLHMRADRLLLDEAGKVTGVEFTAMPTEGPIAKLHTRWRNLATSLGGFSARAQAYFTRKLEASKSNVSENSPRHRRTR